LYPTAKANRGMPTRQGYPTNTPKPIESWGPGVKTFSSLIAILVNMSFPIQSQNSACSQSCFMIDDSCNTHALPRFFNIVNNFCRHRCRVATGPDPEDAATTTRTHGGEALTRIAARND